MGSLQQKTYNLEKGFSNDQLITNPVGFNPFSNFIGENQYWTKIGIQAPPGTEFFLNGSKFYVGRNGIFELNSDLVRITSLYFSKPQIYIVDTVRTNQLKEQAQMESALCGWWYEKNILNKDVTDKTYQEFEYGIQSLSKPIYYKKNNDGQYIFSYEKENDGWQQLNSFCGYYQMRDNMLLANKGVYVPDITNTAPLLKNIIIDYVAEEG